MALAGPRSRFLSAHSPASCDPHSHGHLEVHYDPMTATDIYYICILASRKPLNKRNTCPELLMILAYIVLTLILVCKHIQLSKKKNKIIVCEACVMCIFCYSQKRGHKSLQHFISLRCLSFLVYTMELVLLYYVDKIIFYKNICIVSACTHLCTQPWVPGCS